MIMYRYALDNKDNLIDVHNLVRADLTKTDKFFSVDFKQELIPRLGHIKKKHFAHKPNINILGSSETYLHGLGKKIFYDEYLLCLQNKTPFYLNYIIQKHCNRLQHAYNITCKLKEETEKFDLAKYFTEIFSEKRDDVFIPDILLLNPKTKEKIYVEIAVTHISSDAKKNSGNRIIEFILTTEEDAQKLIEFKNGNSEIIVRYHNFKKKQIIKSFCTKGDCHHLFNFFSVASNGKCDLQVIKENEIQGTIEKHKSNSILNILETTSQRSEIEIFYGVNSIGETFQRYLARAYQLKVKVKNCYICRHHAQHTPWDFVEGDSIFCKFQKINCGSSYATKCQYYRVDQSYINHYLKPQTYYDYGFGEE